MAAVVGESVDTGHEAEGPPDGLPEERAPETRNSTGATKGVFFVCLIVSEIKAVPIRHDFHN